MRYTAIILHWATKSLVVMVRHIRLEASITEQLTKSEFHWDISGKQQDKVKHNTANRIIDDIVLHENKLCLSDIGTTL